MENQTRFDLNTAIANWQQELAAQSNLTSEVRRELETHLRDSITELRQRGLNEKETFWLARRRVGQPQELGKEFQKNDPAKVWRERVFWVALGLLAMRLWIEAPLHLLDTIRRRLVYAISHNFFLPDWVLFYFPLRLQWIADHVLVNPIFAALFRFLPIIAFAILLAQGRMSRAVLSLEIVFRSRCRFLCTFAAFFLINYFWEILDTLQYIGRTTPRSDTFPLSFLHQQAVGSAILSGILVALIAWLMPTRAPLKPKTA